MMIARSDGLTAKDIMRRDVITVDADTDVWALGRLLSEKGITGAPVTNGGGEVIGVVSQTDIVRHLKELAQTAFTAGDFYAEAEQDYPDRKAPALTARQIMNPLVVQADESTPAHDIGRIMMTKGVHRIIVTREGKMVGIITTMDLLKFI